MIAVVAVVLDPSTVTLLAAFPLDLVTIGSILGMAVVLSGVGALLVVRSIRHALEASQETVDTLLKARTVAKEALAEERARWEHKVDALEAKVLALEAKVAALQSSILDELLAAAVKKGGARAKPKKRKPTR